ncbi:MAG: apolipoprotein N-acyltransferase, partial [Sphingopyxis sp.]
YPLDWYVEPASFARARLSALLGPKDWLLTGAVKLEPNADRTDIVAARNSLFSLDSTGQLGPRYDKSHLVPYGEYLPMRPILSAIGLSRLAPGAVDFWAGPGARTLDLRAQGFGRVGVQICYEIIFSGHVVDQANRPDFLYNPSNDAWFGAWGPPQHLAQARLRAMEEGLPVIRATPTGISAIIAADGRILSSIAPRRAGRIDALAPPPFAPTPFARFGNLLSLIFALWCGVWAVANRRRHR